MPDDKLGKIRRWVTPQRWGRRLLFRGGAVAVGAVAIMFAMASEYANGLLHRVIAHSPLLPFVIAPLGLALAVAAVIVAGITSLSVLGNYTYFGHTSVSPGLGWIAVPVCGVTGSGSNPAQFLDRPPLIRRALRRPRLSIKISRVPRAVAFRIPSLQ